MNRCRSLWVACALGATALLASAQTPPLRPFPPKAERGVMQVTQPPELLINGKAERLSPGARIRGTNNMLVMSGALLGQSLVVKFVREPLGLVHEVWVLTEAEAQATAQASWMRPPADTPAEPR
jgi:hypothetical protein